MQGTVSTGHGKENSDVVNAASRNFANLSPFQSPTTISTDEASEVSYRGPYSTSSKLKSVIDLSPQVFGGAVPLVWNEE